jgi:2-polyprenyl-3-methyl-5-hydroxy-6-metoxy-1,4-benzoquinol methylase
MELESRSCSMCRGELGAEAFPYRTCFNGQHFSYRQCQSCDSVIVATVPTAETFARMYAKENYHDNHYAAVSAAPYLRSARLLSRHLPAGATVLDYGCGAGAFLASVKAQGLLPFGVEFDAEAANHAAQVAGCTVFTMAQFEGGEIAQRFDAIHLGDVLEHMPDPMGAIDRILTLLKPGGVLFLEGPLENNPSLVFWAARMFGAIKRSINRQASAQGAPTHLIRTHAAAQRAFVGHLSGQFKERHWRVYETGWPYRDGGVVKRCIAGAAQVLSGVTSPLGLELGNRFEVIYEMTPAKQVAAA